LASLKGEYGHIIFKEKGGEIWNVYKDGIVKEEGKEYVFKTVHIGLQDSEEVNL
jgi:hypothetical protein